MQSLLHSPWQSVKYMWMVMTLKKHNFYREVNPMTRVYSQVEMVLFAFSITVGHTFFHRIPMYVLKHGDLLMLFWVLYTPVLFITAGCFAEMAALIPAVGAHYHYCYNTICEAIAFFVGWQLLLTYTVLTLNKFKYLSEFIDHTILDGWISNNLRFMDNPKGFLCFCFPGYVDILSPILAITMAIQSVGAVRISKTIVNILTSITIVVMILLIISFATKMDFGNIKIGNTPDNEKLYEALYLVQKSLMGYESLSVLGEEAIDPATTIPLSIMTTVRILMLIYLIYTFTMGICLKDDSVHEGSIDKHNPIGSLVLILGLPWLYWITALATVCSIWSSAYGSLFITTRILYAMSRDGMIFKHFSKIDKYTRKPAVPAMIFGLATGLVATFVTIKGSLGIGGLIWAKIMSTVCLLITRYRCENNEEDTEESKESKKPKEIRWVLLNCPNGEKQPTKTTHNISLILIYDTVISALSSIYCIAILYHHEKGEGKLFFQLTGFFSIICFFTFSTLLRLQPKNDRSHLSYITPAVPVYPLLAIISDLLSSVILSKEVWLYGFIWSLIGIVFYFSYSIWHSQESRNLYADGSRWNPLEPHADLFEDSFSGTDKNL